MFSTLSTTTKHENIKTLTKHENINKHDAIIVKNNITI